MGYSRSVYNPDSARSERGWITRKENARRMALADKIVMAVVNEISNAVIRPGPTPEERECYVMADELHEHSPTLRKLVSDILKVEKEENA